MSIAEHELAPVRRMRSRVASIATGKTGAAQEVFSDTLATRQPSSSKRARKGRVLKLVRRVHLYLGLALLPWVLLYGLTAVLFNHASWMGGDPSRTLSAQELAAAGFDSLPSAERSAERAIELLSAAAPGAALALVPDSALWLGSIDLNGRTPNGGLRLLADPNGRGGVLSHAREGNEASAPPAPEWTRLRELGDWQSVPAAARSEYVQGARALYASAGVAIEAIGLRRLPELRFAVEQDGRTYSCDLGADGALEVQPAAQVGTWRERLLRLHKLHGDPGYAGARRVWSLLVDAMGLAMIAWGLSGVVMWWAIRPTRRIGLLAIGAGCAAMAALALALWSALGLG